MAYNPVTDFTITPKIYAVDLWVENTESSDMTLDVYVSPDYDTPIYTSGIPPSGTLDERLIIGTDDPVRGTVSIGGSPIDFKEVVPYNYMNEPLSDEMNVVVEGLDGIEHDQIISRLQTLFESNTDLFDAKDAKIIIACIEKFYTTNKETFVRNFFEFCRRDSFQLNNVIQITLTRAQRVRLLSIFFTAAKTRIGNRISYLNSQVSNLTYLYNITPDVSDFVWLDT